MRCVCGKYNKLKHKDVRCDICWTIVQMKKRTYSESIKEMVTHVTDVYYTNPIYKMSASTLSKLITHHLTLVNDLENS